MSVLFSTNSISPYSIINFDNPVNLEGIVSGVKELNEINIEKDIYIIVQGVNCSEIKIFAEPVTGFGINFQITLLNPDNSVIGFNNVISLYNIDSSTEDVIKKARIRFSIIDNIYLIKKTKVQANLTFTEILV